MHTVEPIEAQRAREFLLSRIDYERQPAMPYAAQDLRLDRMRELLARLGNPHHRLRVVHVAGTKGKGSTSAMVARILQAAGYRTGLYTSPHLDRVEERLAIDGVDCPPLEFAALVTRVEAVVAEMDRQAQGATAPTYFDIITALAMLRFAEQQVDFAVLEVGLGGRLDSTNVCDPLVAIITSISFDHMKQLGNTLAAIAGEKAGIIKPSRPVISGVLESEPREVVERVARQQNGRLIQLGRDFEFRYRAATALNDTAVSGSMDYIDRTSDPPRTLDNLSLGLHGAHQAANAALALTAVRLLADSGWDIPTTAVREALAEIHWPARVEVIGRRPTIVLDAAHNVASIQALVQVLDESFIARKRVLVFATSRDKDVRGMLKLLLARFDAVVLTRYANNPRGVPVEELADIAAELSSTPVQQAVDAAAAWQQAAALAGPEDLICITGSFFIAAEMRAAIAASQP